MSAFQSPAKATADCIQDCRACAHLCQETLAYCQADGRAHGDPQRLALLALCSETCTVTANAIGGGSDAHVFLCVACSQVSLRCAESCSRPGADAQLRACAAACTLVAGSCADLVHLSGSGVGAGERRVS